MSFLKEIYNTSGGQANKKVQSIARELNIELLIGDNYNWVDKEDEHYEHLIEEAVLIDKNLATLLENKGIQFSKILKEDFIDIKEGEEAEVYFKDNSGLYFLNIKVDYLDINGVSNLEAWIDFNQLCKSIEISSDGLPA